MLGQELEKYFVSMKFSYLEINDQISAYAVNEENHVKICVVVNNTALRIYSSQYLSELEMKFRNDLASKGYESLDILFLVYTDDVERDKECINYTQAWLLDVRREKVIIYDNQPQEFVGLGIWIEDIAFDNKKRITMRTFPIITVGLILINILIFIFLELNGSTLDVLYMLENGASSWQHEFKEMELYRLFTCMFIHFGEGHLVNNMLMLYIIGSQIEALYGRFKFLFIYLSSGLIASIASSVFNMIMDRDNIISGGASGAIYGIMGAMVVAIWFNRKELVRVIYRILIVIILIVYSGFTETGVDNVAHIAGFVSGLLISGILYCIINSKGKEKPS